MDISLLFQTARTVVIREGIQQCNEAFPTAGQTLVHNDLSCPPPPLKIILNTSIQPLSNQ